VPNLCQSDRKSLGKDAARLLKEEKSVGRGVGDKRSVSESETHQSEREEAHLEHDLVFDFTGLNRADVCDLALILTARLHAAPEERVWVRALHTSTWSTMCSLGVDHLFHIYPVPGDQMD
jgi:hypothetical protein